MRATAPHPAAASPILLDGSWPRSLVSLVLSVTARTRVVDITGVLQWRRALSSAIQRSHNLFSWRISRIRWIGLRDPIRPANRASRGNVGRTRPADPGWTRWQRPSETECSPGAPVDPKPVPFESTLDYSAASVARTESSAPRRTVSRTPRCGGSMIECEAQARACAIFSRLPVTPQGALPGDVAPQDDTVLTRGA